MNKEIEIQLQSIKENIVALRLIKQQLQKENLKLEKQLSEKEKQITAQKEQVDYLQMQVKALQLVASNSTAAEKKELRKTIDRHIASIDATINLLNE
jgi:TolA-binding protein